MTRCDYEIAYDGARCVLVQPSDSGLNGIKERCVSDAKWFYNAVKNGVRTPMARCDLHEVIVDAIALYGITEEQYIVQKVLES